MNIRYSIDISDSIVRVIRVNRHGIITNAASAELAGLPETVGKEFVDVIAKAVKKAARGARVPLGVGLPCAVVTGGPHVIIRRFSWPEMDNLATGINAAHELAAYLPEDPSRFTVNHRVVRHTPKTDTSAPAMDVMVAAIPTDIAEAIVKAVNKTGFAVKRLDARENARGKLTEIYRHDVKIKEKDENPSDVPLEDLPLEEMITAARKEATASYYTPESFVVLDVTNPQINISIYLDGIFYSNRYFSASANPDSTDTIANEISSIIDYIQYRERSRVVQCILMIGEEDNLPGITQSLKDYLDIPIFTTAEWVGKKPVGKKFDRRADISRYLDAYGTIVPPFPGLTELNIMPEKKPNVALRTAIPITAAAVFLGALTMAGIFIPNIFLTAAKLNQARLNGQLSAFTATAEETAALQAEVAALEGKIGEVEGFLYQYPQASQVIPAIRGVELALTGQTFDNVTVSDGSVTISGTAKDLKQVADDITAFGQNEMFSGANSSGVDSSEADLSGGEDSATFNLAVNIVPLSPAATAEGEPNE